MEYQSNLDKLIQAIQNQTLLNKLALGAEFIIKQRTRRGVDVDGDAFQDYSESYKKVREKNALPTHPVNLTFDYASGMMQKVDHVVMADLSSVSVLINDPEKELIGQYHNSMGAGKSKVIRKWWGIKSEAEKESLVKIGWDTLKAIIKSL